MNLFSCIINPASVLFDMILSSISEKSVYVLFFSLGYARESNIFEVVYCPGIEIRLSGFNIVSGFFSSKGPQLLPKAEHASISA